LNPTISSEPEMKNITAICDGNLQTEVALTVNKTLTVDFKTSSEAIVRSLIIKASEKNTKASGEFYVKEGSAFRSLKKFEINRSNPDIHVGFDPFAPIVLSIPETKSTHFRLVVSDVILAGGIAEVELSAIPKIERYPEKSLAKMFQTPLPYWKDYLWPVQPEVSEKSLVIDPKTVVDISKNRSSNGTIKWNVPPGRWKIMETGMTTTGATNGPATPEATGLETDKMSKKHIAAHFDAFLGEIIRRIPEADRKTWKVAVQDSYETGGQNWTDGLIEEFTAKYGYSPVLYMPVLKGNVVGSRDFSDRFLWDLRRLVADKVSYDFVGGFKEVCNKNGLTTWLENYGHWGFPGEFLQYGGQSDEIGGEFWSEGELGNIENRAATSCGHIYGKQKISAESNTCGGFAFSRYPGTIKQRGDRFFAEGINNTLLHVYITQPYEDKNPGVNAPFGNEFNRKNTWFSQMDVYTQYLKRTNFMLQQGLNVADVAYFIGEDAPKMTGITDPPLLVGYQFDYMNAEVIEKYMTVKNGLITLPHGTQYRILVIPKLETMRPELLVKIKQLVNDGAVVLGPAPKRSPSLQNQPAADQMVAALASELWGNVEGVKAKSHKFGKGMIINGMDMKEALALINCVPDCKLPEDKTIHYGHRTINVGEIYFITNQTSETKIITPEFRVKGLQPELWEATTGNIRLLPAFNQKVNTTEVPIKLEAYESVFVVFRKLVGKSAVNTIEANYPAPNTLTDIKGPWTVNFNAAQRGPAETVVFQSLIDWTTSNDERIKYYSGTAFYNAKFRLEKIPAGEKIAINLGEFTAMAKVSINGKYAGGLWTAPFTLDITTLVKQGENDLQIEIVNTWMNRLIGDLKQPVGQGLTWCPVNPYKSTSPLQPSGLFGPVKILSTKEREK